MAGRNFNTRSSCEMHQDFAANTRVPPKSAPGRLENASSALSLPNPSPGPPPSLSVHCLHLQSVFNQQKPNLVRCSIKSCLKPNSDLLLPLCQTAVSFLLFHIQYFNESLILITDPCSMRHPISAGITAQCQNSSF